MSYMQARSNKLSQARRNPWARNPRAMRNPGDMKRDKEFEAKVAAAITGKTFWETACAPWL